MTDNEIIKALRAVAKKYEDKPVATFEINIRSMTTDAADHIERLCDEINRQKAEIERWKEQNVRLNKECDHFIRFASTARAEAIREFAGRLENELAPTMIVFFVISEILVDVSKAHLSPEQAVNKIRDKLNGNNVIFSRGGLNKLLNNLVEEMTEDTP